MADLGTTPSASMFGASPQQGVFGSPVGGWTDPRMMLAQQLIGGATDASPVRSWTQELARALSGPVGAYELNSLNGQRADAMSKYGDQVFGVGPSAQVGGGQGAQDQPGLLSRVGSSVGNFLGLNDPSTMGAAQPAANPDIVARSGSPEAAALDSNQGNVTVGGTSYGPKFTQPPANGPNAAAPQSTAGTSQPQAAQTPPPASVTPPPDNSPLGKLMQQALAQYNTGKAMIASGDAYRGQALMQQAIALKQGIMQKQAEAQITGSEKALENGKILNADNSFSRAVGFGEIDAQNAALKDLAENPALTARAGGIAAAENPYKIQQALAPKQFDLQTGTQVIHTPGGDRLVTNAQAAQYAQNNSTPAAPVQNPDGTTSPTPAAPIPGGAIQNPKVQEAQLADIGGAQKRFSDAQARLQNLNQIMPILTNPNLFQGMGGDQINDMKNGLITAYKQMGVIPDPALVNGVANAAQLKSLANNLAIEVGKDEGTGTPRISIFNAISQNKPNIGSTPEGNIMRVLAMQQAAQREIDYGNFVGPHYQDPANYNKLDAEQAFAEKHPVNEYTGHVMPSLAKDPAAAFAAMPDGQIWIDSKGNLHTKGAAPAVPSVAPSPAGAQ